VNLKSLGKSLTLLSLWLCILLNSLYVKSAIIGVPVSLAFFFVASCAVGDVFFSRERRFFRIALGLAAFLVLTALFGSVLIIAANFSEIWSLVMVGITALIFSVLSHRRSSVHAQPGGSQSEKKEKGRRAGLFFAVCAFVVLAVIGFYALATARTGEGGVSVWLTIPSYFLPSFFVTSLLLVFILFFARVNVGLKLSLVSVYSLLMRSLFWIVWYPGRYGDPWTHLGRARFIAGTGMPYAYSWLLENFFIVDLIGNKAQYTLVVLLTRMFRVDIYWVNVLLIPFLWSFLVPLASYKVAEMLLKRRSGKLPLVAALASSLVPSLVVWGTVSVPNSVGFIFFLFAMFLLLYWMHTGARRLWFLSLLTTVATFVAHFQPGIFAFMFFLLATAYRKISRIMKVVLYLLSFVLYPAALYLFGAHFSLEGLVKAENLVSLQSEILTVILFFGLLGWVLSVKSSHVNRESASFVFVFYVTIILEYYLSMYGMLGLPFGPERILIIADFLLLPFAALGVFGLVDVLARVFARTRIMRGPSGKQQLSYGNVHVAPRRKDMSKKVGTRFSPRAAGFVLISVVLSAQATLTLHQAYPHEELLALQPSVYEMEAIYYINSTAPEPYVVLCDTQVASLATGLLGIDYGYAGGGRGIFGVPAFDYPTIMMYGEMILSPSFHIMQRALDIAEWVKIAYFVVSIKVGADFEKIVEETSAILPIEAVFGDGKLYVFRYPLPVYEGVGPSLKVVFDDGTSSDVPTTFSYMHKSDVSYRVSLSGHSSYNVTEYPDHWIFSNLTVDGVSCPFDESSDTNEFIFVSAVDPSGVLNVTWKADDLYPNVGWRDSSFKSGWQTHPRYTGTIRPNITAHENVLEMSWNFTRDMYQYYYYVKPCNVSTDDYPHVIVRWKSTGPIAIAAVYFEEGSLDIVPPSSQSSGWTTTVKQLPPNKNITMAMVGITNLNNKQISRVRTVSFDFILISGEA